MFVIYSCGCVCIKHNDEVFIIEPCDGNYDDDQYTMFKRNMINKKYRECTPSEVSNITENLADLIYKGQRFSELKRLLKS
jgi:hypothetical protein